MKKLFLALIGATIVSTAVSSLVTPVFALGDCGPNRHRDRFGYCVFGGQNQNWCLRHTGRYAVRFRDGTLRCL